MLMPTSVNDSKSMLFGLDTGAFSNTLSVRAGRQVSKVSSDDRVRFRGLNGEVNKVYSSEKATLHFGHLRQPNHNDPSGGIRGFLPACSVHERHSCTHDAGF